MHVETSRPQLFSDESEEPREPEADSQTGGSQEGQGSTASPSAVSRTRQALKRRATEALPTPRFPVSKQLEILRAHYIAHGSAKGKAVHNAQVASIVRMHVNNVSLPNAFFVAAGLLAKQEGGHVPTQEAINYGQACEWKPGEAPAKLAPAFERTWFYQTVRDTLSLRAASESEIVVALATASSAPQEDKPSLLMLIEYLSLAGLIAREGDLWRLPTPKAAAASEPEQASGAGQQKEPTPPQEKPTGGAAAAASSGTRHMPTSDGIHFNVTISVDMDKMRGWTPDRIAAFFAGMAAVIAAEKGELPPKS
jgi:hypothetical protein